MGPIIYIMGVSGSGKSTVGKALSDSVHIPFFDGDDFHPMINKEKMSAGIPLDDDDRYSWLKDLNSLAREHALKDGAIIACSALKKRYRSILAENIEMIVQWVLLHGTYDLILQRMKQRTDHFMPEQLLQSQFDILEIPEDAFLVDIRKSTTEIVEEIKEALKLPG